MTTPIEAYNEGYTAYIEDAAGADNPYNCTLDSQGGLEVHDAWDEGWWAALEDEVDALTGEYE